MPEVITQHFVTKTVVPEEKKPSFSKYARFFTDVVLDIFVASQGIKQLQEYGDNSEGNAHYQIGQLMVGVTIPAIMMKILEAIGMFMESLTMEIIGLVLEFIFALIALGVLASVPFHLEFIFHYYWVVAIILSAITRGRSAWMHRDDDDDEVIY